MIEFDIESGAVSQADEGIHPTHKITFKQGVETSTFWYLQNISARHSIEPYLDNHTARQLLAKAQSLLIGDFLYFATENGRHYHIHRLTRNRFTLKPLA
jgi:hypothetical protein